MLVRDRALRGLRRGILAALILGGAIAGAPPALRAETRVRYKVAPALDPGVWLNAPEAMDLARLRGQVVLLDFWSRRCGVCRQSLPLLDAIQERYAERGFTILAVHTSADTDADKIPVAEEIVANDLSFPVLLPAKLDATMGPYRVGQSGVPYYYLVDKTGRIRHGDFVMNRFPDGSMGLHPSIEPMIEQLLAEEPEAEAPPGDR